MKSGKLVYTIALGVTLGASALLSACGGRSSDPLILAPTTVTLKAVATPIQVQILDGAGVPVTGTDFTLTITGANKGNVVDALGNAVVTTTTTGGAALLTLASGTALPATFNVMVAGTGYLPTGQSVTVSSGVPSVNVSIPVVKLDTGAAAAQLPASGLATVALVINTAAGVSGNVTVTLPNSVSSTGVVTAPTGLSFKSPDTTTAGGTTVDSQAKLNIPAGVKMTDAAGNAITGTVTANVVSYSPSADTALAAFPGGFAADVQATPGSTATTPGTFVSGGFVAFNMTDSTGKTVKNFDTPVAATIIVPKDTVNPDGSAVVVGQAMPIWSYDETKGTWVTENSGTVTRLDDNGNYVVTFNVNHLSYWNMDWHYSQVCTARISVTLPTGASRVNLSAKFTGVKGFLYTGYADSSQPFLVKNAPANKPVDITMTVPGVAGTTTKHIANMCASEGVITLDASTIVVPVPGSVSGKVYEACFNNGAEVANTRRPLVAPVTFYGNSASNQYQYRTTTSGTDGAYSFAGIPIGSAYSLSSYSPRRISAPSVNYFGTKSNQSVTSGNPTTAADFVFPMTCILTSGGGR